MAKLKSKMLNIGYEKEVAMWEQLNKYDEDVVGAVDTQIKDLKEELEHLTLTANTITVGMDMNEYMKNQQRLKDLPNLIMEAERERLSLINNKDSFQAEVCKSIYKEIGEDYSAEFADNMETLVAEYDVALTKLIAVYRQMEQLERDYDDNLHTVLNTKGVYASLLKAPYINKINETHNLNNKSLYLNYAK